MEVIRYLPYVGAQLAVAALGEGDLSDQTVDRLDVLMHQFSSFVERGHGLHKLSQVTPAVVAAFIVAPSADLAAPGPSLRYFRRLAVRQLFRACREFDPDLGDPTVDVVLPSRSRAAFRPLDDDEVELSR